MVKKIRYILLFFVMWGCYPAHQHTYPTLDGKYVIRHMTKNGVDIFNEELSDDIFDEPMTIVLPDPTGPLDTMKIGKTRISFSGNIMFSGYYLNDGNEDWREQYNIMITQDFITGRWVNLHVDYNTNGTNGYRKYFIYEDGIEYIILDYDVGNDTYSMYFDREGA